jgi:hypothetical protein
LTLVELISEGVERNTLVEVITDSEVNALLSLNGILDKEQSLAPLATILQEEVPKEVQHCEDGHTVEVDGEQIQTAYLFQGAFYILWYGQRVLHCLEDVFLKDGRVSIHEEESNHMERDGELEPPHSLLGHVIVIVRWLLVASEE